LIHEERSIFGDGIFELIDVNHSGAPRCFPRSA
jgi:hypothetical protein